MTGATRFLVAAGACCALATACGASSSASAVPAAPAAPGVPAVTVVVAPRSPSVPAGGTVAFSATVTGAASAGVTWTVDEGAAGGAISAAGVYTAPGTPGTYHVTATSVADPAGADTAAVTVTAAPPATLADQLAELASRRIWFGHQSTGANIIVGHDYTGADDGLAYLIATNPGCGLSHVTTSNGSAIAVGVFGHGAIGVNGDPTGKIDDFARKVRGTLRNGTPADLDHAFFKLCWADFGDDGGLATGAAVDALFAHYGEVMDALAADFPGVKFLHVTTPLRTPGDSYTGRATNALRERYNAAMRARYPARDILDLADWECTGLDGRRVYTNPDGTGVFYDAPAGHVRALSTDWDSDGGHLDSAGSTHIARRLVQALAAVPR